MTQLPHGVRNNNSLGTEDGFDLLAKRALRRHAFEWSAAGCFRSEVHDQVISSLHTLAAELRRSTKPLLSLRRIRGGRTHVGLTDFGRRLIDVVYADFERVMYDYRVHRFSPVFETVRQFARRIPKRYRFHLDMDFAPEEAAQMATYAKRWVNMLRRRLLRDGLKAANENFRRGGIDIFNGTFDSIEWLSQSHPCVTSTRFDLHVGQQGSRPVEFDEELEVKELDLLMALRERFHRSLDRQFGKALLGYVWVLEHGRQRGFHIHYLLLLDPRGHEDHCAIVEAVGRKWCALTGGGEDDFFNCHLPAKGYRFRAIGLLRFDDHDAVKGLRFIVVYMTLATLFVKLDIGNRCAFGKGRFPKAPAPSRGRPKKRSPNTRIRLTVREALDGYLNAL